MNNFLETLEAQANHIETLKGQVLQAKVIKLHTGLEGFNSPESYGIYKHTGGDALGVVGNQFQPMDLKFFLDAIQHSVLDSGVDLDLTKLTYNEFLGGSKVAFRLPFKKYEIASPMVGDILETALEFRTGFDGQTKMSLGFYTFRMWCSNGAKNWRKDVELTFKNTKGNASKLAYFASEIVKAAMQTEQHVEMLNKAVKKPILQADLDRFMFDLTGYKAEEYNDLRANQRKIFDAINEAMAIEMENTGANLFSLLQGVTRYTTHNTAKGDMSKLLYGTPSKLNAEAHTLVAAELN